MFIATTSPVQESMPTLMRESHLDLYLIGSDNVISFIPLFGIEKFIVLRLACLLLRHYFPFFMSLRSYYSH